MNISPIQAGKISFCRTPNLYGEISGHRCQPQLPPPQQETQEVNKPAADFGATPSVQQGGFAAELVRNSYEKATGLPFPNNA